MKWMIVYEIKNQVRQYMTENGQFSETRYDAKIFDSETEAWDFALQHVSAKSRISVQQALPTAWRSL